MSVAPVSLQTWTRWKDAMTCTLSVETTCPVDGVGVTALASMIFDDLPDSLICPWCMHHCRVVVNPVCIDFCTRPSDRVLLFGCRSDFPTLFWLSRNSNSRLCRLFHYLSSLSRQFSSSISLPLTTHREVNSMFWPFCSTLPSA